MSFPRYERYKDSGVEWLGEVPEHWRVIPVRSVVHHLDKRNEGAVCQEYLSLMANIGVIPYEEKGDIGNKKPEDLSKCKIVRAGNIVINSMNYNIGSYGMSRYDGVCSPVYVVLAIDEAAILSRFAFRIFQNTAFQRYAASFGNGILAHRAAIGWDELKVICVTVPPEKEQQAILSFLDDEIAKIDALIEEQRRLIGLLKEKRQAVISHAVTKGLNPDAPMKDSGINWIGDVPEPWRIGKCGFYLSILSGFAFPSDQFSEDESETRLLRGINVGVGRIRWDETVYWRRVPNDGLHGYEMRDGDLILGMDRPLIGGGVRVAKLTTSDLPCLLLQRVTCLKVKCSLNADYLLALLSSDIFIAHFAPETTGVSVPHISPEQIANFMIPLPPIEEQDSIATHIRTEMKKSDQLTNAGESAIQLLQERRSAIISATVTGKIDVRNYIPKEAA